METVIKLTPAYDSRLQRKYNMPHGFHLRNNWNIFFFLYWSGNGYNVRTPLYPLSKTYLSRLLTFIISIV